MFTVNVIDSMGNEMIYQAKRVSARPDIKTILTDRNIRSVHLENPDGSEEEFRGDFRVFVMNDNGKTVATYYLGVPEGDYSKDEESEG